MNGFDLLAPVYDKLVFLMFGNSLYNASVLYLDQVKAGDKILIIGGGTGKILKAIHQNEAKVFYVESSLAMIRKAQRREINFSVEFIHGSYTNIPDKKYDVVVTPFFLDIFSTAHAKEIVADITKRLEPGARWLIADFIRSGKKWHKVLVFLMYRFFRLICGIEAISLPDYDEIFRGKYGLKKFRVFFNGMIMSRAYDKI